MNELLNLDLSGETLREMAEINPDIMDLSSDEIKEKIEILKLLGCRDNQVLNIISSNPLYLSRLNSDVVSLISYLNEVGFTCLRILFDSNPYILNLDVFEVRDYIDGRIKNGETLEDIVDDLDSNTYLFNEM